MYSFQPYDVLQIEAEGKPGTWLDYATIRDEADAAHAEHAVTNKSHSGFAAKFRIVRYVFGKGHVPVYSL